jgi:hypothetical protein
MDFVNRVINSVYNHPIATYMGVGIGYAFSDEFLFAYEKRKRRNKVMAEEDNNTTDRNRYYDVIFDKKYELNNYQPIITWPLLMAQSWSANGTIYTTYNSTRRMDDELNKLKYKIYNERCSTRIYRPIGENENLNSNSDFNECD